MTVALVQSREGGGDPSDTPRFDSAPTAGNLMVLQHTDAADVPTGWTDALGAFVDVSLGGSGFRLWYRVAQAGDPAIIPSVSFGTSLWIVAEFSGVTGATPIAVASSSREGPGSHPHQAISPAGTDEVLILGAFIHVNTLEANFDADAGYTLAEHYQYPSNVTVAGLLYKVDALGAGFYDPGVSTAPFSGMWAGAAIAWAGSSSPPPTPPDPPGEYEAPSPGRAILEIYVSDPTGDRWDEALWDTATWGDAGWVSITPWSIFADVSWGADRAEAGILSDQVPGTWVVETHDPDRVLDPGNPDSQFYPEIGPGLPIRLLHHSRIIRQGEVTRAWYSHADRGGRINATDAISKLANARVPEDTILSDTLRLRAIEAIEAAALDIIAWPPIPGGDPALSPAPSGDFSAWDVISEAAREVLHVPWVNNGNRLTFRPWDAPLVRGRVITAPNLIDLSTWTSDEGLFSVVRAQEPGGALEERRATPTPRYGERVHERTRDTINAEAWAGRVLADRRDASLRYVPGDIYPLTDADVAWLARLEIMEDVVLFLPSADPPVLVTARILGMHVRAVDETVEIDPITGLPAVIRTRWRWRLITTVAATTPLTEDGGDEFLYADQDPDDPLYPDGA